MFGGEGGDGVDVLLGRGDVAPDGCLLFGAERVTPCTYRWVGVRFPKIAARCSASSATTPSTYALVAGPGDDTTSDLGLLRAWDSVVTWLTDHVVTPVRIATATRRPARRLGLDLDGVRKSC